MSRTASIIREEHRSLAIVVHCMESLLDDIETKGTAPDFELLHTALHYLSSFTYEFHHPKETGYLFPALLRRAPARAAILDELERQHHEGKELIEEMHAALDHYQQSGDEGFERFKAAVDAYHAFEWAHIRLEEKSVLPFAEACLTDRDWGKIDSMFLDYRDPVFGEKRAEEFRKLFDKIVDLGPFRYGRTGD